jgi:hypothetical protein
MDRRNKEHLAGRKNPGLSTHYNVAGNATIVQAVQLCELDEYAGGTKDAGEGLRDICEQLFVLFLDSYHPSVLRYQETYAQKNLAQAINEDFDFKNLARTYSEIAQVSLAKTGFALPGLRGRQKDFGTHSGINKESPMGMGSRYDKLLWTVQHVGDRWHMQRSSFVLSETRTIFNKLRFDIQLTAAGGIDTPQPKDTIFLSVDVMKQNAGGHRSPYVRCPTLGPFSNWDYANKVAFKIIWCSAKDNLLRRMYVQQKHMHTILEGKNTPGCSNLYAVGVALYAYFTRSHWEDKPDFVPNYGKADLLFIDTDMFNQKITTKIVVDPLVRLPKVEFAPQVARKRMRDELGYQNVDGEWNPLPANAIGSGTRFRCDACIASQDVHDCVRIGDSNLCETCKLMGLPCSWTSLKRRTERNLNPTADFYKLPMNEQATKAELIADPGYQALAARN